MLEPLFVSMGYQKMKVKSKRLFLYSGSLFMVLDFCYILPNLLFYREMSFQFLFLGGERGEEKDVWS